MKLIGIDSGGTSCRVVLCDQTKLSRLMPYTFATMKDVDYLISDAPMPDVFQKAAKETGTVLL